MIKLFENLILKKANMILAAKGGKTEIGGIYLVRISKQFFDKTYRRSI